MDLDAFSQSPGRLEVGNKGYFYYVPPRMPVRLRDLDLQEPTLTLLSEADRHVGRLDGIGDVLPNPQLLIQPYMRREAVLSSRIEGTRADVADVAVDELDVEGEGRDPDAREVTNYVRAMDHGLTQIGQNQPLDLELLRQMHAILLRGVRGDTKEPGRFRDVQVYIGGTLSSLEDATYVPPEPRVMKECLRDLEAYLRNPPPLPVLVHCALVHYWFEAIHPFRDGNGRIGRALIQLMLIERRIMNRPLLYVSAYFEQNRARYYDLLQKVSTEAAYDDWIRFFIEAVRSQAKDGIERSRAILDLSKRYHERLDAMGANQAAHRITDVIFERLATTIPRAAKDSGVSYQTAQRAIEQYLEPSGILVEVAKAQRSKTYLAKELLQVIRA